MIKEKTVKTKIANQIKRTLYCVWTIIVLVYYFLQVHKGSKVRQHSNTYYLSLI